VSVSTKLLRVMSSKIFLVSVMGMLEYILEMSKDAICCARRSHPLISKEGKMGMACIMYGTK